MKHEISLEDLGPSGASMATAVETCVHCGFCLTNCPTYRVLGQEMDSPRGRIILMKEVLEGNVALEESLPHVDRCLGCLACETHCPSGVHYRDLLSPFRDRAEPERKRSLLEQVRRFSVLQTLPYPGRFRFAARLGQIGKRMGGLVPKPFRPMLDLLPDRLPKAEKLSERYAPEGEPRARVALLAGCAQQVLAPEINRATIDVLVRNGVEVLVPKEQGCCGALAWHVGEGGDARAAAIRNLQAFPRDLDAIITNAAGCGSGLQEYPLMLKGEMEEADATAFSKKVKDVSEFLFELGIDTPRAPKEPVVVAYHDACHLSHGQRVRRQPRELLRGIPNLELREIADGEICCGSAGTYNVDQPEIAGTLGQEKAGNVRATGADYVAMGNIGCLTQIAHHLNGEDGAPEAVHTIVLLQRAYAGEL